MTIIASWRQPQLIAYLVMHCKASHFVHAIRPEANEQIPSNWVECRQVGSVRCKVAPGESDEVLRLQGLVQTSSVNLRRERSDNSQALVAVHARTTHRTMLNVLFLITWTVRTEAHLQMCFGLWCTYFLFGQAHSLKHCKFEDKVDLLIFCTLALHAMRRIYLTTVGGRLSLNNVFCRGGCGERSCRSAAGHSVDRTPNLPVERTLYHWANRRP